MKSSSNFTVDNAIAILVEKGWIKGLHLNSSICYRDTDFNNMFTYFPESNIFTISAFVEIGEVKLILLTVSEPLTECAFLRRLACISALKEQTEAFSKTFQFPSNPGN
jgi:hypothetical protein